MIKPIQAPICPAAALPVTTASGPPIHGGRLHQAAQRFAIPVCEWIDLSTGINPHPYPLPDVPASVWQQLPDQDDRLHAVAASYYGSKSILPVSGSQAAIEILPRLKAPGRVGILSPAYAEYAYQWQRQGHRVEELTAAELEARLPYLDVVVVIRPNNPTTELLSEQRLLRWLAVLQQHQGWLVVDEAFLDATPESSLLSMIRDTPMEGLIVLRSVGKFFGLAGIRLGFVWAQQSLLQAIAQLQPLWAVSSVARWAGTIALGDDEWQSQMRQLLSIETQRLAALLQQQSFSCVSTPLFCTLGSNAALSVDAAEIFQQLAKRGVLVRYFAQDQTLRLGLPANESAWQRLEASLAGLHRSLKGG